MTPNGSGDQSGDVRQRKHEKWNSEWVVDSTLKNPKTTKKMKRQRCANLTKVSDEGWVKNATFRSESDLRAKHKIGLAIFLQLFSFAFYFSVFLAIVFCLKCKGAPKFFNVVRENVGLLQDAIMNHPVFLHGQSVINEIPPYKWVVNAMGGTYDTFYRGIMIVHKMFLVKFNY